MGRAPRLRARANRTRDRCSRGELRRSSCTCRRSWAMEQRYVWRVAAPGPTLSVHIESHERERRAFDATLALRRAPLTARPSASRHGALPGRDAARAGAHLRPCACAEAQGRAAPPASAGAGVTAGQRIARRIVLGLLARLRSGQLTIVEGAAAARARSRQPAGDGGGSLAAGLAAAAARKSRAWPRPTWRGCGTSPDLTAVVRVAARNVTAWMSWRRRLAPARVPLQTVRGIRARNTRGAQPPRHRGPLRPRERVLRADARRDDDVLLRVLPAPRDDARGGLERQARAGLSSKLDLRSEDHVLEIGTGWGGFAVHAATTRGCRVTTTTISREQYEYARARVRAAGVADRVTVLCEDYRDLRGRYDKLVSIEMIEAVGWRDFDTFFARCSELLGRRREHAAAGDRDRRPRLRGREGLAELHSHAHLPQRLPALARGDRALRRRGTPTCEPSDSRTSRRTTPRRCGAGAPTSRPRGTRLEDLGYDERFRRLWRMYLAYCEAGFAERRIGVVQTHLAKPRWREYAGLAKAGEPPLALAS